MNQPSAKVINSIKLFLSLALTLTVGFAASLVTSKSSGTWYTALHKPFFNPPKWLFAPVWSVLYVLMAISFYLVWKQVETAKRNVALFVFVLQLALNGIWSFIFFNMREMGWALVDITILWVMIIVTMNLFAPSSKLAAWLMYPYLLWVTFATLLNFSIWELNW
ncbi:MAG: TspO/MBR family protein [Panacibacter sp.]